MTGSATKPVAELRTRASRVWEGGVAPLLLIIAGIALLVRLPLLFAPGNLDSDARFYLDLADKLSFGPQSTQFNTLRTPGYPLVVAPLRFLPGGWLEAIVVSHHLLGAALAPAATWAGWRYFGRVVGVAAGLAVALSPLMATVESAITPDILVAVIQFAGALILTEAVLRDKPDMRLLAAAGVAFALAAYCKPSALPLALAAVVPLAVATRSWRVTLRGSLVLAITVGILVLPWMVRNWAVYDTFTMSTVGDMALFSRVVDQDRSPINTETPDGVLVKRVYDGILRDFPVPPLNTEWMVHSRLKARGYSHEEIAALEGSVARDTLTAHPGPYVSGTAKNLFNNARVAIAKRVDGDNNGERRLEQSEVRLPLGADRGLFDLGRLYGKALWLLSLNALLVLVLLFVSDRRQRVAAAALGSVWLLAALTSSATYRPDPRYIGQVAPILWLLEAAALVVVISAVVRWISLRRGAKAA